MTEVDDLATLTPSEASALLELIESRKSLSVIQSANAAGEFLSEYGLSEFAKWDAIEQKVRNLLAYVGEELTSA